MRPAKNKVVLTERIVRSAPTLSRAYNLWDAKESGLVVRVQTSGFRSYKFVYSKLGRARWVHIGVVPLADARRIALKLRVRVAEGGDPLAERQSARGLTFATLHQRYLEEHAKKRNKSWRQGDAMIQRHVMRHWGSSDAKGITRADARALMGRIAAPVAANQTLAAASAVFSWAVKQEIVAVNPCRGIELNTTHSRERVLSATEIRAFWEAVCDLPTVGKSISPVAAAALKTILLCGQRPGEVRHMRREHIKDNWWEMPGEPVLDLGWPGTKNKASHRVWLAEEVRAIVDQFCTAGPNSGFVFATARGKPISGLERPMRLICKTMGLERATPHDLRRTFGSTVTALRFGRQAMDRILNHADRGIGSVYDRHGYAAEDKKIMERVADHLTELVAPRGDAVIPGRF